MSELTSKYSHFVWPKDMYELMLPNTKADQLLSKTETQFMDHLNSQPDKHLHVVSNIDVLSKHNFFSKMNTALSQYHNILKANQTYTSPYLAIKYL